MEKNLEVKTPPSPGGTIFRRNKQSIMIAHKRGTIVKQNGLTKTGDHGLEALAKIANLGMIRGISLSSSKNSNTLE